MPNIDTIGLMQFTTWCAYEMRKRGREIENLEGKDQTFCLEYIHDAFVDGWSSVDTAEKLLCELTVRGVQ